jgi:hypothetical protein
MAAGTATVIGALIALIGLFVGAYLTRWREHRTKRIQLTIEHAEKQLSEFYSPLLALVEQLDTIAGASNEIEKANVKDRPNIDRIMWEEIYSPVHDEILTILKTKIHLIEGFDIKESFTAYLHHYASQKIYWQLVAENIIIPDIKIIGYPEEFYWDIRTGLSTVSKRYETSLQELRDPFLRFSLDRAAPLKAWSALQSWWHQFRSDLGRQ